MNPQEQVNLYREALALIFGSDMAHRSRIYYRESTKGRKKIFWVNRPMRNDNGGFVLSPTGWKPFTPEEFDVETAKLFNQALDTELKMSEAKPCSQ